MGLIERRIGLLFAVFLAMLVLAAGRASWLGVVRGDSLKAAAATQQKADIVVPARRGAITDVHGTELAISRPAVTITATPYLVDKPAEAAHRLAKALDMPEGDILRKLVKDALGDTIEMADIKRTEPGKDVRLTLDAAIQDRTEEVLGEVGETWRPKGATALVMNPDTGAIIAMANWPRVNANKLYDAPEYAMTNRATGATYEPGSTFKAFTVAGALEDGKVTPSTEFSLPPVLQVADREISDAHARGWETRDVAGIIKESSNVGAVKIGMTLGATRFDQWIQRFGFGKQTGVDLPGEESGILLPLDKWSGASMGNLPMGQGLAVTPIQMGAAYSAIANGGILRPPHIVASVGGVNRGTPGGKRVISEKTASEVRTMLEGVLGPGGTATGAAVDGYKVSGKTGTAEKPDEQGGYSKTKFVASFVGFAPAKDPKLLVAVMVDEPQGDIYGGTVAGPAFKDIMSFALTNLRIPPS